jgi:tetratricopeptide (TPR) repeat protein
MQTTSEQLIDYLDRKLNQEESYLIESRLKSDKILAGELEYMKLAIDTVRLDGIRNKVSAIRDSIDIVKTTSVVPTGGIVRSMYKFSLRIAAILVMLIGITILYKYISVSSLSVYQKEYTNYEMANVRGEAANSNVVKAFLNKDWNEVIAANAAENIPSNQSNFLAGMAELQLNHFPLAVNLFQAVLNAKATDNSFQEEAEYYISLSYLRNHEVNKAIQMLNKIKADPNHTYYPLASKISGIDLKIIELKGE